MTKIAIIFLLTLSSFNAHGDLTSDVDLRPINNVASLNLNLVKQLASAEGIEMTREQTLFVRDFLLGYFHRAFKNSKAHLVWLRIPKSLAEEFRKLIPFIGKVLDPEHGIEHMRYSQYLQIEPPLLAQKMREQRKHLLVMDDFTELLKIGDEGTQVDQRLISGSHYWQWVKERAHERVTIFILDEDGELLRDEFISSYTRMNFLGTEYIATEPDHYTLDYQSTEAINALRQSCRVYLKN